MGLKALKGIVKQKQRKALNYNQVSGVNAAKSSNQIRHKILQCHKTGTKIELLCIKFSENPEIGHLLSK